MCANFIDFVRRFLIESFSYLAKMTISFWTYFGEALLDADFLSDTKGVQMSIAQQVYAELVGILQRKSRWPPTSILESWSSGVSPLSDMSLS